MDSQAIQPRPENAQGSDPTFAHIPYNQRWEPLKSTIIKLYMQEREKIPRVAERMKNEYNFSAVPSQYRYQFKKWGIKKRITSEEKDAIINAHGKRLRPGSSLSQISIDEGGFDKSVDKKALKRYIGDQIRHEEPLQADDTMFLRWHLPYAALLNSLGLPHDQSSPFGSSPKTPPNINTRSPGSDAPSGQSPTTQMVRRKVHLDRAKLLLQGREMDLMRQLKPSEREATFTWLHDRWMYSFMTAKYWGKGPRYWTAQTIEFKTGADKRLLESPTLSESHGYGSTESGQSFQPKSECHWTIHHHQDQYEALPDPPDDDSDREYDIEDESTWPTWTSSVDASIFSETVNEGLGHNAFSKCPDDDMPFSAEAISQHRQKSSRQRKQEDIAFAIMARNFDLLSGLLDGDEIDEVYDICEEMRASHLAATYLDGSRQCCLIISALPIFPETPLDQFGHTVLDNIFLTILRSHTRVIPCALYATGQSNIPFQWKHEFCHTMESLLRGLEAGQGPINIGLIKGAMMTELDGEGFFGKGRIWAHPIVNEVCKEYFGNVEQWGRIKFITTP
ncbi:hypothetical protein DL768_007504 [Monosporascus sp. mg162]|nr:hypothetical protein DL768_007504 [Monosporascus sp. mg162]